jgi:putative FmdB family regulatory protein
MPFYEYQCKACGAEVEVLQKISDAPLKKCPECGKSQLVKLVSAPVFRLKGSGWYETDFKTDQDKKRNLVEAEAAPKAEEKSEAKPEAKPEAKAETKAEARPEAKSEPKSKAKPVAAKARPKVAAKKPAGRPQKAKAKAKR